MKIAVISDSHLGHAYGTEKENDSFENFTEAIDKAVAEKADIILLPGDIFDSRVPRQEVWAKALEIFQKPLLAEKSPARLEMFLNGPKAVSEITLKGIPVVAIHGTHERRGEGLVNPIEMLESAGFLIHLHKNGVVFDINGTKIAIHGLGGVPERDVKEELLSVTKPVPDVLNIFMLHQSTKEEIYDKEDTFISVDELPAGFDMYIDGHIHWRRWLPEKKFLIPGSTVITQQREREAREGKGFFMLDIADRNITPRFVNLEKQRRLYFKRFEFENATSEQVIGKIKEFLSTIQLTGKKPMVKIKLIGKMEKGRKATQIDLAQFKKADSLIVSIDNELESEEFKKLVQDLRKLQAEKKSVDEMGTELITRLLKQTNYDGIDVKQIIEPLAAGQIDVVIKKVLDESHS